MVRKECHGFYRQITAMAMDQAEMALLFLLEGAAAMPKVAQL
jgi:hypothetical protein